MDNYVSDWKTKQNELAGEVNKMIGEWRGKTSATVKILTETLTFEEQKLLTDTTNFISKLNFKKEEVVQWIKGLSFERTQKELNDLCRYYQENKKDKFPTLGSYFEKLLAIGVGDLQRIWQNLISVGDSVKKVEELEKLVKSMKESEEKRNEVIKGQISSLNNQISSLNQQLASKNNLQIELDKERNWWGKWFASPQLVRKANHPILNQPSIPEVKDSVYATYSITVSHPWKSNKEINETATGSVGDKKATVQQVRLIVKGVYEYWRDN